MILQYPNCAVKIQQEAQLPQTDKRVSYAVRRSFCAR